MRSYLAGTLLVILAACQAVDQTATAVSTTSDTAPSRTVTIKALEGTVEIRPADADSFSTASVGQALTIGDSIRTGTDGRVGLLSDDGSGLSLMENSLIRISTLDGTAEEAITQFFLDVGQVLAFTPGELPAGAAFEIITPAGVAAIRGSVMFVIWSPAIWNFELVCVDGVCDARPDTTPLNITLVVMPTRTPEPTGTPITGGLQLRCFNPGTNEEIPCGGTSPVFETLSPDSMRCYRPGSNTEIPCGYTPSEFQFLPSRCFNPGSDVEIPCGFRLQGGQSLTTRCYSPGTDEEISCESYSSRDDRNRSASSITFTTTWVNLEISSCSCVSGTTNWECYRGTTLEQTSSNSMLCGGTCGNLRCDANESATSCYIDCVPVCGDLVCGAGETAISCSDDCGTACGDGTCNPLSEFPNTCPQDCGTVCNNNGVCDPGESLSTCVADCGGGAGGSGGPVCPNGLCESGEDASSCVADCGGGGEAPVCPNGTCESGEDVSSCPADCGGEGAKCPNGTCEIGEDASSCPADCGGSGGGGGCICEGVDYICRDGLGTITYVSANDSSCGGGLVMLPTPKSFKGLMASVARISLAANMR